MLKKYLLLVNISLLSGCSLAPEYIKPQTVADRTIELRQGSIEQQYSFKDLFAQDKPLLDLLEHTMRNNYDLQQAMQRVTSAQAQKQSSMFDFIPGINLSASKNISMASGISPYTGEKIKQKTESYQSSLGVDSYEVDIWGKKITRYKR